MFTLDKNDLNTENKLLLLYLIDQFSFELTNSQIAKLLSTISEINYFYIQQYLIELVNDGFLFIREDNNNRFYSINENGKEIISSFKTSIKASLRNKIDKIVKNNKDILKNESQIYANYKLGDFEEYIVTCGINEGKIKLVELKLLAGTSTQAQELCESWKNNATDIYAKIIGLF